MSDIQQFIEGRLPIIWESVVQTFQMVSVSLLFSVLLGLPLGVLLILTRPGNALENRGVYQVLNVVVNIIRSIPFIILLFFILPFTKLLVGTSIGIKGAIVPLIVHAVPNIARLMESALLEVDSGVVEAYRSMGIRTRHIIWHVLLREARPSIILGLTIALITLIGGTAMAGLVGAGGLGDLAYRFGHLRYEVDVMYVTVFILILLVQCIQTIGNKLAAKYKKG
ncbi:methionine ABC transporter permease [Brevibacillus centrosporus]|uniref:D-methionine transport system permease protein n=1 Tax=Brevibacillus centrosporus TaxID=54910 RepID=A0A1I3MFA0_9BACL|nr:methionine ABC transporter permease [Brevibacillus centrosporus]MEC2130085.1 ABC transporter permease [Brevibacillus centrosporus]MED4906726.1 ABC transporter permease [Brevibacillus centrosporus]RNB65264.1 ABC transporter permease [Brevibacillus centrosporus]SFI95376.1 D-methionine transport system permease protein [Brevibacillus centrosporus]GED33698.1 ABC transporter permease [Brevibacillus centrosporus]